MRLMIVMAAGAMACLPLSVALAQDAERGAQQVRRCLACHNMAEGEGAKIGPNLFGIVGRPAARFPGFSYSIALAEKAGAGLVWTPETLDQWLENPRQLVPGTKMNFAGVRGAEDRADIIAYLASISPGYVPEGAPPPPPAAPSAATRR
jgi:cytochrome c